MKKPLAITIILLVVLIIIIRYASGPRVPSLGTKARKDLVADGVKSKDAYLLTSGLDGELEEFGRLASSADNSARPAWGLRFSMCFMSLTLYKPNSDQKAEILADCKLMLESQLAEIDSGDLKPILTLIGIEGTKVDIGYVLPYAESNDKEISDYAKKIITELDKK